MMLAFAGTISANPVVNIFTLVFAECSELNKKSGHRDRKLIVDLGVNNRLIGYARVSTDDQDVSMQLSALRRAGVLDDNLWYSRTI